MRCAASADWPGSCDSAARAAAVGGPAVEPANALPSAIVASATTAQLTQRSATRLVEEVQVVGVDGDGPAVAELQLHVRRERRDEVRPGPDDACLVAALQLFLRCRRLGGDLARIHLEVRHPLAPQPLAR